MDVAIISRETVSPFLHFLDHPKPFKLSLLDQLAPFSYTPMVLFFPMNDPHLKNTSHISSRLKWSLSKALTTFYPLAGRIKDNLIIDDFQKGIPYLEARVSCQLSHFLENPHLESLNNLLPSQPFCLQPNPMLPQVAVQVNIFDCGGIALGTLFLHKIIDGATASSFSKNWADICGGSTKNIIPNFDEASLLFPPLDPFPSHYTSLLNTMFCPPEKRQITRRYVFDVQAISALKLMAKSELVENPTHVEMLSSFIWKSSMASKRSTSAASIMSQAVEIRARAKPRLSRYALGNLRLSAKISCDPADMTKIGISHLVGRLRQSITKVTPEYIKSLCGERGRVVYLDDIERFVEDYKDNPCVFTFSSWNKFGSNDMDFGWGKPVWSGVFGGVSRVYPSYSNLVILKNSRRDQEMEAWVTLDEKLIATLENNPEFTTFAKLNPSVLDMVSA